MIWFGQRDVPFRAPLSANKRSLRFSGKSDIWGLLVIELIWFHYGTFLLTLSSTFEGQHQYLCKFQFWAETLTCTVTRTLMFNLQIKLVSSFGSSISFSVQIYNIQKIYFVCICNVKYNTWYQQYANTQNEFVSTNRKIIMSKFGKMSEWYRNIKGKITLISNYNTKLNKIDIKTQQQSDINDYSKLRVAKKCNHTSSALK